jgi:alkylmercury lyase-like protein
MDADATVKAAIYERWIATGQPPAIHESERAAVERMAERHELELLPDGSLWMAHPFSAVATGYAATVGGRRYDANCIWDALGILALLGDGDVEAEGQQLKVRGGELEPTSAVVHFSVPAARWYEDIGHT